jgi:hypothetical protein
VDCCTDVLPRKVSGSEEYYKSIVPVLSLYFYFLEEEGVIFNSEELAKALKKVKKEIRENSRDPDCWGMAKSMVMGAQSQGDDLFDDEEREEYLEEYNQSLDMANSTPYHAPQKIGRNDPCKCGSGKKYKKCCMDKNRKIMNED